MCCCWWKRFVSFEFNWCACRYFIPFMVIFWVINFFLCFLVFNFYIWSCFRICRQMRLWTASKFLLGKISDNCMNSICHAFKSLYTLELCTHLFFPFDHIVVISTLFWILFFKVSNNRLNLANRVYNTFGNPRTKPSLLLAVSLFSPSFSSLAVSHE